MAEQGLSNREEKWIVGRALLIPVLAFLVALLLIYTRSPPGDPGATRWIEFPEVLGGENLRRALKNIVGLFGLSCLPGGLIGIALGSVIIRSSRLVEASLRFLRIAQWVPFILWWPIAAQLLIPPDGRITRYFFIWAIGAPAVALAACYHYLSARFTLGLEWQRVIFEVGRAIVLQGLFMSLMLALSVWSEPLLVYPGNENVTRHYVVMVSLALFLIVLKWVFRSSLDHTANVRKEILFAELNGRNGVSLWDATLLVLLCLLAWQFLSAIGYLRLTPVSVLKALLLLLSVGDILKDMGVSLLEVLGGLVLSGGAALVLARGLSGSARFKIWMTAFLPLTYIAPIVLLPTWISRLGFIDSRWTILCVAVFSFFPFMQVHWGLRDQPLPCRTILATDDALPYAFTAIIYGEMMSSTAGLGFAVVVASATYQTDKGLAVFLLTLVLLVAISSTLRWVAKRIYFSEAGRAEK